MIELSPSPFGVPDCRRTLRQVRVPTQRELPSRTPPAGESQPAPRGVSRCGVCSASGVCACRRPVDQAVAGRVCLPQLSPLRTLVSPDALPLDGHRPRRAPQADRPSARPVTACLQRPPSSTGSPPTTTRGHMSSGRHRSARRELVIHRTPTAVTDQPCSRVRGRRRCGDSRPACCARRQSAAQLGRARRRPANQLHIGRPAVTRCAGRLHSRWSRAGQIDWSPLADRRAESPPESWLRWVCHDAGFPPPVPQFWVHCPTVEVPRRPRLADDASSGSNMTGSSSTPAGH